MEGDAVASPFLFLGKDKVTWDELTLFLLLVPYSCTSLSFLCIVKRNEPLGDSKITYNLKLTTNN